jgi:predicted phage baseplate assembly protein
MDGETVKEALERAPLVYRGRDRAVTASDYEHIVRSVAPELARIHCVNVADDPGAVRVLIVPAVPDRQRVELDDLVPGLGTLSRVGNALEAARVVGCRIRVEPPEYVQLIVVATVACRSGGVEKRLHADAVRALFAYFNPLTGGPGRTGWPLGRPVTTGDVYGILQGIPDVDSVDDVRLFWVDPETGRRSSPVNRIDLHPGALLISHDHQVRVVQR